MCARSSQLLLPRLGCMTRLRKRKHDTTIGRKPASDSSMALARLGKSDFARGDYLGAIVRWERAQRMAGGQPELLSALEAALAEAHFRQALAGDPPDLLHLEQAARLAPQEPRFRYHLARAYFVHGKLKTAADMFRQLLHEQPPYRRAALPLAIVLMSLGRQVETDPVWEHLSPDEQQRVRWANALLQRGTAWVRQNAPVQGADACWGGLARVALSETEALPVLQAALEAPNLPPLSAAVVRYYRGVLLAGQQERTDGSQDGADQLSEVLADWYLAQQDGLRTPWLSQNIVIACQRRLNNLLEGTDSSTSGATLPMEPLQAALAVVQEGLQHVPSQAQLIHAKYLILLHMGYAEAMAGQWANALKHWQAAHDCGGGVGFDRVLAINLALAYEKNEKYAEAAELWRSVVRHRPRRADAMYALSEAQVARVWQHVAESYRKAGNFGEAIRTYRNAIKWAPHNVELRLNLVETLLADGRPMAASSVVQQVLADHPDHVEALAWQAQILEVEGWLTPARKVWERVLELDPQHGRARPHLARVLEFEGDELSDRGMYEEASALYQRSLEFWPRNSRVRALLGVCQARLRRPEVARQMFEETLRLGEPKLGAYYWVIRAWIGLDQWAEALAVLDRAEKLEQPPDPEFYLDLAAYCESLWRNEWASVIWERALARFPDDPVLFLEIAVRCGGQGDTERAIALLRQVIKMQPDNALAHLWLANYYIIDLGQRRLAERHWRIAEELARKSGNKQLLLFIHSTRDYFITGRKVLPPDLAMALFESIVGEALTSGGSDENDEADYVPDVP